MDENLDLIILEQLKNKMDGYKSKLTDKYNRSNSRSRKKMLSRELVDFSYVYRELFGSECKFEWDNDIKVLDNFDLQEYNELITFVNSINDNNDFYFNLSSSVINSYSLIDYPFYKYFTGGVLSNSSLDKGLMIQLMFSFLKDYDYENYIEIKNKFLNFDLLEIEFDDIISGSVLPFSSVNNCLVLLNSVLANNLYKYETTMHEVGHVLEMLLIQKSNNLILLEKGLETPYSEVSSCFFEYAFLNYLKENKLYVDLVNRCLDNYFKELLSWHFYINLVSKFSDLEIEENGTILFGHKDIIKYGNSIKKKLNYYSLGDYENEIIFKQPFLYGIGQLFSIYLYENYKVNSDFSDDFKKALLAYPLNNDISTFYRFGINEENLINGDIFRKVLKKNCIDFKNS